MTDLSVATSAANAAPTPAQPPATRRADIATLLLDRLGDERLGLRTREQDWTWDAVVRESAARAELARELRRDGPFHIGVLLENVPDFVFWLGAAALAGATVVGINPTRGNAQLEADIRYVDCQLIVTDAAGMARLRALDLGLESDRFLLVDDPAYAELLDAHRVQPVAYAGPEALLLLLFTSGTTGTSKAVKCTQRRLAVLGYAASDKFGHVREDVDYCCMPLFHGNAIMALWAPALVNGATVCLTPKFSATGFLSDVRYFGATFFTYVGKALGYLLATPATAEDADTTLVRGFGTEASVADQAEFRRRFAAELFEGYGSSEGPALAALDPQAPAAALGRPAHPGVAVVNPDTLEDCPRAVLDEYGRVLNPDESVGEMVDKAGAIVFEGYYKNDVADAERLRNGWYWTGDLGYIDEAGFLYFGGRKGDWLRVDGENTSTLLIEQVVRRHPAVIAAAVYGVPDPRSGDRVMAAIEVADPDAFDVTEFAEFLSAQDDLGSKGAPRLLRVSGSLPVTGSNKVLKRELQEQRWHTDELLYRWFGRGKPEYEPLTDSGKLELEAEFVSFGRANLF
ncbi:AMP-binding protein [Nocardia tengchongensis]|uniref:AMP-binding protein n=1 Tax=Nocardia tengchongensis TaxID=2055889 RepID=UPI00362361A8